MLQAQRHKGGDEGEFTGRGGCPGTGGPAGPPGNEAGRPSRGGPPAVEDSGVQATPRASEGGSLDRTGGPGGPWFQDPQILTWGPALDGPGLHCKLGVRQGCCVPGTQGTQGRSPGRPQIRGRGVGAAARGLGKPTEEFGGWTPTLWFLFQKHLRGFQQTSWKGRGWWWGEAGEAPPRPRGWGSSLASLAGGGQAGRLPCPILPAFRWLYLCRLTPESVSPLPGRLLLPQRQHRH